MKNDHRKKIRGFTLMEMVVVMVVITTILGAVIPAFVSAADNSKVTSTVATIRALQTASANYYLNNGGTYTGGAWGTISMVNLVSHNMLPSKGIFTNAWGGAISVSPDANANYVDIALTGVPAHVQQSISIAVSNLVSVTPTYLSASSTWTAGF